MKVPRWIWGLDVVGSIAVANLVCLALCGLLYLYLFPDRVIRVDVESQWKIVFGDTVPLLAFPVGWITAWIEPFRCVLGGPSEFRWTALLFVPLNGYFWGLIGKVELRRRMKIARRICPTLHRCSNPNCSVQFAEYLIRCPACASPAPERSSMPTVTSIPTVNSVRPSLLFILTTGVAAPIISGGLVLVYFILPAMVGVLAGACFILLMIRWINRREDPRKVKHPAPIPDIVFRSR